MRICMSVARTIWGNGGRILLSYILAMLVLFTLPLGKAKAETYYTPDVAFQINQLEVYANCLEEDDQGWLINFSIGYSSPAITPSTPIDTTFIFRASDNVGAILSTTTAYGFFQDGYGDNVSQSGIAWIYFSAADAPTWEGNHSVTFEGNPTLTWNGGLVPNTPSSAFSLWYDGGTLALTQDRLTIRLKAIAQALETNWGSTQDLIEDTATGKVLTTDGEDYFTNTISNLRTICPGLFYQSMAAASYPQDILVLDYFVSGSDGDVDIYGLTQYAQTFTASEAYSLSGVQIPLYRVLTPGSLTISLRATVGGVPSGANLVSGTYDGDSLTTDTNGEWIEVAFTSDYALTSATTYAIVVTASAGDVANYVAWLHDTGNGYTGGQECSNIGGGGWVAVAANDLFFELLVRGGESLKYGNKYEVRLLGTQFDVSQIATNWGMTNMAVSTLMWLAVTVTIIVAVTFATASMDTWWIIFGLMSSYGWRAGFADTYLLVGYIVVSALVIVYGFYHKKAY